MSNPTRSTNSGSAQNISRSDMAIALACVAGVAICQGSVPVMLRHIAGHVDPWNVNALRYGISALFWLPFIIAYRGPTTPDPAIDPTHSDRPVWRAALVPTLINACAQIGWALCFYFNEAAVVGFVIKTTFLFTMLLSFVLIHAERALMSHPAFKIGAGVCLVGTILMGAHAADETAQASLLGIAIVLATAFGWAAYTVSVRLKLRGYPPQISFGWISLFTSGVLISLAIVFGDRAELTTIGAGVWFWITLSSLMGIAWGHVMLYRAIMRLGPVLTGGLLMITPLITTVCAMIFLGEKLSVAQSIGGGLIIVGGLMLHRAKRSEST